MVRANLLRSVAQLAVLSLVVLWAGCDDSGGQYAEGGDARMNVTPLALSFPQLEVGQRHEEVVYVRNDGNSPLVLPYTRYTLIPASAPFLFSYVKVDGVVTDTIPGGAQGEIVVTYLAEDDRQHQATLRLEASNGDRADITLNTVRPAPILSVDPNPIVFSSARPNTESRQTAAVRNAGTARLTIESVLFSPGNTTDFSVISGLPTSPRSLLPGESFEIEIAYVPTGDHNVRDVSHLLFDSDSGGTMGRMSIEIIGMVAGPRIEVEPAIVDFGAVDSGQTEQRNVYVRNVGEETLEVHGIYLDFTSSNEFSYGGVTELALEPGEQHAVSVSYSPANSGIDTGYLVFESNDPLAPGVRAALVGAWAGPVMDLRPTLLDFGQVAARVTKTLSFEIYNDGTRPLTVNEMAFVSGPSGLLSYAVEAGLVPPFTVPAQGKRRVAVTFAPTEELPLSTAQLEVRSNDPERPNQRVNLRMIGLATGKCEIELVPRNLNFGLVPGGYEKDLPILVRNKGAAPCAVNGVQLKVDFFNIFYPNPFKVAASPFSPFQLQPGESRLVDFNFKPYRGEIEEFAAQAVFNVSDPLNNLTNITCASASMGLPGMGGCSFGVGQPGNCWACLTGSTGDPAIATVPNEVNFGLVTLGCASQAQRLRIYNKGTAPTDITGLALGSGCAPKFTMRGVPPLPKTLSPGTYIEVELTYRPSEAVEDACVLDVTASTESLSVPIEGTGTTDENGVDVFNQVSGRQVDVLFVVDSSGSMGPDQQNLANNFDTFIQMASNWGVDFQLGVTTMDDADEGRLQSRKGHPRIIASEVLSAAQVAAAFKENIKVGTSGSATERGLKAAESALSPPIITANVPGDCPSGSTACAEPYSCDTWDGTCGGYNAKFLREDASLEIILVSDEVDQSPAPVDYYVDFFKNIKGFRNDTMMHVNVIVGWLNDSGSCDMSGFNRYKEVANRTGGRVESLCGNFAAGLAAIGDSAFGLRVQFFLSRVPVPATIQVRVNNVQQSTGWTFDAPSNAIIFDAANVPPENAVIRVNYKAACF